ncbi:MAG TPA: hypothetical protein VM264_00435 [Acidimicrobiales bacterium]|nr:hypothetical protein [Acidimicrobiales bacterium]
MAKTPTVETRADRVALVQDAGMKRVSLGSALAGALVAYGAFAVLLAVTAAVAKAVGFDTDLSDSEWRRLGAAGGALVALVLLASYLYGGYVAGRMARRAGSLHGFLVFVTSVVLAVGVTALVNLFTDGDAILADLRAIGIPTSGDEWRNIGTVAGIGSLLAMLLGSLLGGRAGERWHGKLLARALDPAVGPEAEAARVARERHAEAEERVGRARAHVGDGGTVVMDRSEDPSRAGQTVADHRHASDGHTEAPERGARRQ